MDVFPGNQQYTLDSLTEELALMERHLRDGSWRVCSCNPEKHLPLISGLASEAVGFTTDPQEKQFMKNLRDYTRKIKPNVEQGLTDGEAEELREWTRQKRLAITNKTWTESEPCRTCNRERNKVLNTNTNNINIGESRVVKKAQFRVGAYVWAGKIVNEIVEYANVLYPGALMGYNPSVIAHVLGIPLALWGPKYVRGAKSKEAVEIIGWYLSTGLYEDFIEPMLFPTARLTYRPATPYQPATVPANMAQGALGKYV